MSYRTHRNDRSQHVAKYIHVWDKTRKRKPDVLLVCAYWFCGALVLFLFIRLNCGENTNLTQISSNFRRNEIHFHSVRVLK
jgi:hypothetical protein